MLYCCPRCRGVTDTLAVDVTSGRCPDCGELYKGSFAGSRVDAFCVIGEIARGANGVVYLAQQPLLTLEAMKMQHVVSAGVSGIVRAFAVAAGDTVFEDSTLAFIEERADLGGAISQNEEIDPDHIRGDLKAVLDRRARGLDAARPKAVAG